MLPGCLGPEGRTGAPPDRVRVPERLRLGKQARRTRSITSWSSCSPSCRTSIRRTTRSPKAA